MKENIFDCIIIGGGPAGSTTASCLADMGYTVLVLEKAKFPRPHVGESLLPFLYNIFEDLGVLDQMKARFTRKPGVKFSNIDGEQYSKWCFKHVIKDDSYLSFHVVRAEFDDMLLHNSRSKGAQVLEETRVLRVDFGEEGQLSTVVAEDKDGKENTYQTKMVIDASGQDSLMARQMKTKVPFEKLNKRVALSTHWKNLNLNESLEEGNIEIVHLEGEKLGWIWMIPVGDDRLSIGVALNMDYSKAQRKLLSKSHKDWQTALYLQEIATSPEVSAVLKDAEMVNPLAANGDFSYYSTQKYGKNFALVGDAGGFIDPIFSSGIYLGMKGAQLVSKGVDQYLREGKMDLMDEAYRQIDGAYKLVEKLVTTFYDPDSINFAGGQETLKKYSFQKFETAYSILHLILAGDFFSNHEKYLAAIEILRNPDMIDKYRHLIGHPEVDKVSKVCAKKAELVDQ
ncbi:MAG: NAD(P)/FAD-dependent oxidoreductase [Bacteroidetes bacterium]|nr:NAD(P)/FAD-dependent oxidoreductase [Bacteroidota bacterium]